MSVHSGFLYYFDLLGLDRDSLRVHYRFDENSGILIPNDAPSFPQLSGELSSVGDFYSKAGSGFFTGQSITVQNATGLPSEFWSHIFVFERTGAGRHVLFDSLMSGDITSGYVLGVNDGNKLYFDSYDQNGPVSKTSSVVLGKRIWSRSYAPTTFSPFTASTSITTTFFRTVSPSTATTCLLPRRVY